MIESAKVTVIKLSYFHKLFSLIYAGSVGIHILFFFCYIEFLQSVINQKAAHSISPSKEMNFTFIGSSIVSVFSFINYSLTFTIVFLLFDFILDSQIESRGIYF